MAYTNIESPKKYFDTKLYTGNGSTQSITGLEFSPDFTWLKHRNNATAYSHQLYDTVRGATNYLISNTTAEENDGGSSCSTCLTSFNSDGFSLGSNVGINASGVNHVSWNWRGSDSSAVSNTSGTISSTVSVNTTSGFSIVSWTGTGTTGTVGHGLGVAPSFYIVKRRNADGFDWFCYHKSLGATKFILLDTTGAEQTSDLWNDTSPTSTVFNVKTYGSVNASGGTYIAYCFAEVKGYSKFGSYTGNGSTDGTFIYTGFKPAFVMAKASSTTGQWSMCDTKRGVAPSGEFLFAESTETTNSAPNNWDFVSNGFKARANYAAHNTSGVTYIYMAFAENPFVSSKGIPTTAR